MSGFYVEKNLNKAKVLARKGKTLEALEIYNSIIQKYPENKRAQLGIQQLKPSKQFINNLLNYYQSGKYDETKKLALLMTKQFPLYPFGWKVLGAVYKEIGQTDDAVKSFQNSLKLAPQDAEAHNNLGIIFHEVNRLDEAKKSFNKAITINPHYASAYNNLGNLFKDQGKLDDAQKYYNQSINLEPKFVQAHNNLGNTLKELGKLEEAEARFNQAINLNPEYYPAYNNLGNLLVELDRLDDAETILNQAIKLNPNLVQAYNNLGITLKKLKKFLESESILRKAIAIKSDYSEAYINLSATLQELKKLDESEIVIRKAIELKPNSPEAYNNLAHVLRANGKLEDAEMYYRQALALDPTFSKVYFNLGNTVKDLGKIEEALDYFKKALELDPDFVNAHINLSNGLRLYSRYEEALKHLKKALSLEPANADALNGLAVLLGDLGKLDEAKMYYSQSLDLKPRQASTHRHFSLVKKYTSQDEQFKKMLDLYSQEDITEEDLCHINFGLGKAYQDLGDFKLSFKHFNEGNILRKKLLNYNITQDIELFNQIMNNYHLIKKNLKQLNFSRSKIKPIFIVGMPRSGTTLVEQIISSHSKVTGAGELIFVQKYGSSLFDGISLVNKNTLANFREQYLDKLETFSKGRMLVTDKNPQNFRYIGLLSAAFPEAKIIHVKRNPAAVCWGNYINYFISNSASFAYNLEDIVKYYKLYDNLMEFWSKSKETSIYDLDYELLTANKEKEIKSLIQYLELDWDENCLFPENNKRSVSTASSVQVREKIYQGSSKKWEQYKPFLNGIFDNLK